MAPETVTLPLADFQLMRKAFAAAVDATVAIQELCKLESDGLPHGIVFAIELCCRHQEDLICDAQAALDKFQEVAHG